MGLTWEDWHSREGPLGIRAIGKGTEVAQHKVHLGHKTEQNN